MPMRFAKYHCSCRLLPAEPVSFLSVHDVPSHLNYFESKNRSPPTVILNGSNAAVVVIRREAAQVPMEKREQPSRRRRRKEFVVSTEATCVTLC